MKILTDKITKDKTPICDECLMIDRTGKIYECIDSKYHPNPGTENDEYSEIERTIDWLYRNNISHIRNSLDEWVAAKVSSFVACGVSLSFKEAVSDIMSFDLYTPCDSVLSVIKQVYDECMDIENDIFYKYIEYNEFALAKTIVTFLNENFLRVRAGGKLIRTV